VAVGGDAFVGRELELGVLRGRLERALVGAGSLVMVAGEAGIGKTRTLGEFAAAARARGALTLWGSSFEGDWHPPYGPWVEALGEVLRLISAGRTTRQIAETMTVSRATVERHITSLYRKIGARGRADATSYALRQGVADGG